MTVITPSTLSTNELFERNNKIILSGILDRAKLQKRITINPKLNSNDAAYLLPIKSGLGTVLKVKIPSSNLPNQL